MDNDDACPNIGVCPQIPIFKVELLGERKFLANLGMSHDSVSPPDGKFVGYNPLYWHNTAADLELTNGVVIPKREAGKWEVRDVYVTTMATTAGVSSRLLLRLADKLHRQAEFQFAWSRQFRYAAEVLQSGRW